MTIKHGYLYWATLGRSSGTEPGKARPVVVVQTDLLNETGHPSTWVLFCTTRLRGENALRTLIPIGSAGNEKESEVMVDQGRAIDNRRFSHELGEVPEVIMKDIKRKLGVLLELNGPKP